MLGSLLWVSPAAQDLLKTASQLLAGSVPCPPAKLASALKEADDAACSGLLRDAAVRADLAAKLEAGCVKEVSDKEAVGLVEALGSALQERLDKIRAAAAPIASKLASKGTMPGFKDVVALLPDGQGPGEALQKDWLLWHAVGHAHSPGLLPEPDSNVVHERLAIAACAGGGPTADCALALHMLENLDAYIAWETSLAGSKPAPKKQKGADLKGVSVLFPFGDDAAKEVAVRRVLASVLPPEAAAKAALEVAAGSGTKAVVQKLAEAMRAKAVIPLYSAPPAPKDPKDKKDGKGGKGEAKEEKPKAEKGEQKKGGAAKGAAAAPSEPLGVFGRLHKVTATQELQWHLLSYRMRPSTTLGVAAKAAPSKAQAGSVAPKPAGFSGIWAPDHGDLPPGHTQFSWYHAQNSQEKGFDSVWAPTGSDLPPGHTNYSWEQVLSGGAPGATTAGSASANAPAPAAAAPAEEAAAAPAPKAKGKAAAAPAEKPKDAPTGGAPAEGSPEAALSKIDIRCGRIVECGRVPDADSLYLLKVNVGEEQPRQVVSSLVKHYKEEELKDRQVVVYCNIKPGKMRGFESQAMVLAATKDKGADDEKCELLAPPKDMAEGTRVMCGPLEAGSQSATQSVKNISKVWNQVQPLLETNAKCEAMFSGTVLTMKDGPVTVGSLAGVGIY